MAIHETNPQEQTWIPYEQAKDCSQGFCSIYCPQWCYIIFPPPPPFAFVDEDSDPDSSSNSTPFSPLVIAIIGILASAFLLISYYTMISKYCGGFRRRSHSQDNRLHDDDDSGDVDDHELRHQDSTVWHVPPSNGLDQALIDKISVYKYKRNDGVVEGTDCSVCLGEFGEEESLRLLPKCSHAFHLQCIDTWLTSHSNCPLCHANIVPPSVVEESEGNEDNVMVEDGSMDREGSSNSEGNELHEGMKEESLENRQEDEVGDVVIDIKEEECSDGDGDGDGGGDDCMCRERVSIGDILKMDMEEEFVMFNSRCSTSKSRGENSKGGCDKGKSLHCVMSSTRMKRSMSGGTRLGFSRQGRARSLVLPI